MPDPPSVKVLVEILNVSTFLVFTVHGFFTIVLVGMRLMGPTFSVQTRSPLE